ncbi:MAG: 1-(5-phosphoribosyl)-5-[(5-phosphoribosylamino)methylideneamino]imidazole-4-carboxamide isomerase [Armatimonadota bacterium]
MFVVLPAIDLLDGKVVRLTQGRYDAVKVYSDEPTEVARQFEREGATWLHVVDLNGAKEGEPKNLDSLTAIRKAIKCNVQFGGGVRSLSVLERLFEIGVQRVILGTSAIVNPMLAYEAVKNFGAERIAVAVDVREGKVAVRGWTETEALSPADVGERMRDAGVQWFVYTDILRDGMMTSPNFEAIAQFSEIVKAKVIASGGIGSAEHVRQLKTLEPLGVVGCIVGRALYEGKLSLRDVLSEIAEDSSKGS